MPSQRSESKSPLGGLPAVLFAAPLLAGLVMLSILSVGALLPGISLSPASLTLGALAGAGGLGIALVRPRWVFLLFIIACMIFPHTLEEISIPAGFMKVYPQDLVFVFNAALIIGRLSVKKGTLYAIPFNRLVVLHIALGLWGVAVGFTVSGNEFDNVFGDFRRSFFYFLNYFVALLLADNLSDARLIRTALVLGAGGAILKGFFELLTGQFVFRRFGDAAHILSHFEVTFSMFLIFYALAKILYNPRAFRLGWGLAAAAGMVIVLLANFRTCWVALMGGMLFLFFHLPGRFKIRMAFTGLLAAIFAALCVTAFWETKISETRSTVGQEIMAKADVGATLSDTNVGWRMDSYANAIRLWQTSPIIGRGLGEELEFATTTSTGGAMMSMAHRVHNSFLWLWMSLGVTGFAVLLYIQWKYLQTVTRYLRQTTWQEGKITVLTCASFYASLMVAACFDVYLESAMPITILSSVMALSLLMIHWDRPNDERPDASVIMAS